MKTQSRKSNSSFTFQPMTKESKTMAGSRSLPGISQAIKRGIANLTMKSITGMVTRCFIKGFTSERPRDKARTVNARSNWFRSTKEIFSTVHCLNVAEEAQRLAVIPVINTPPRRY